MPRDIKKQWSDVYSDHLPVRPDPVGQLEERLASPATDVQNGLSRSQAQPIHRDKAKRRKLAVDQGMVFGPGQCMQQTGLRMCR